MSEKRRLTQLLLGFVERFLGVVCPRDRLRTSCLGATEEGVERGQVGGGLRQVASVKFVRAEDRGSSEERGNS